MRSWTRAREMSGMAWARDWSRRRFAAAGSAVKVRIWGAPSWASESASSSSSRTGIAGGVGSSTPRVARYSARTEWRRWPLGSMFLEGMGGGLSELGVRGAERDEAGGGGHREGNPLEGV